MTIYVTGDKHGRLKPVKQFAKREGLSDEDVIVILGDAGFNYYNSERDAWTKKVVAKIAPTVLCIHGNHEIRPQSLPRLYHEAQWHGGTVFVEDEFPNILFAKDGEVYDLDGISAIAIGGAYSVDKWYRLENGLRWFANEQPNDKVKARVEAKLDSLDWKVDVVLSHTCPFGYEPTEAFLPDVDQSMVDTSTEVWLDRIERRLEYKRWYCGHWHIEKSIDQMRFMFNEFEPLGLG
jgi:3-oxoacid CoA-transferase subunit A